MHSMYCLPCLPVTLALALTMFEVLRHFSNLVSGAVPAGTGLYRGKIRLASFKTMLLGSQNIMGTILFPLLIIPTF